MFLLLIFCYLVLLLLIFCQLLAGVLITNVLVQDATRHYRFIKYISRAELRAQNQLLMPDDTLTLICEVTIMGEHVTFHEW